MKELDGKQSHLHQKTTGLSGNEIYCLKLMGLSPGALCVGNSVFSMGFFGSVRSGLKTLAGGEISEITNLIQEGRMKSISRLHEEASRNHGLGVTGVSTELVIHSSNIEFLTIGSAVHSPEQSGNKLQFSTSADAQELYCQTDAGFVPHHYVLGNVAYSIGVGGGIGGAFKSLKRGEVPQFTEIFDNTRHLALQRISNEAKKYGGNAVVGIETTITPFRGAQEMAMIGTASSHPLLHEYEGNPITSDMTNEEMWNMVNIGYLPIRLVMGVSVYSLGFTGGIASAFRSLAKGEIESLSSLLYEAREKSLDRIQREAERWGADEVVGVKTHIYELGGGLIEFLALGTAVKKFDGLTTKTATLPPQAIVQDKDTYFETKVGGVELSRGRPKNSAPAQFGPLKLIMWIVIIAFYVCLQMCSAPSHTPPRSTTSRSR